MLILNSLLSVRARAAPRAACLTSRRLLVRTRYVALPIIATIKRFKIYRGCIGHLLVMWSFVLDRLEHRQTKRRHNGRRLVFGREQLLLGRLLLAAPKCSCTGKTSAEERERQRFGDRMGVLNEKLINTGALADTAATAKSTNGVCAKIKFDILS
jgi:hypothetical protein